MKIKTHFNYKIPKDMFFIESYIDNLDIDYFINKIEEGIKKEDNRNYATNVKGCMTGWRYFRDDQKFSELLKFLLRETPLNFNGQLTLIEAWGFKFIKGEFTQKHNHQSALCSGIIYLSDCKSEIIFNEINLKINPKRNKFLIFSGHLEHETPPLIDDIKYGIAFNLASLLP